MKNNTICNSKTSLHEVDLSSLASKEIDAIIELALTVDVSELSSDNIHESFFNWCNKNSLNLSMGAVKTPNEIARFIVKNTISSLSRKISDISWLDPCTGSGVFVEELLNAYIDSDCHSKICIGDLPKITVFDVSASGLFHCILTIKKGLSGCTVSAGEYLKSGRLQVFLKNTLDHQKEYFDLIDLESAKFDAVIGNPPYVRSTRLSDNEKKSLKNNFPQTYSGSADLYFYFISSGISSLKDGGIISFISPANFLRSTAARNLRSFIGKNAAPVKIVDLDELPVFDNADIHTLIFEIKKTRAHKNDVKFVHIQDKFDLKNIDTMQHVYKLIPLDNFKETGWVTHPNASQIWKKGGFLTLKEAGFRILSGVRPSYKDAFVYPEDLIEELDEQIKKWFYPCVEGRDVPKWILDNGNRKYLLLLKHELCVLPEELKGLLEPHREELVKRASASKKEKWFALRPCSYYKDLKKTKIIFPDITSRPRFSLDRTASIPMDGVFVIPTDNLVLLGILNSSIAWNYFISHCSSLGNTSSGGRVRLKKSHVENFPLPGSMNWDSEQCIEIKALVLEIIHQGESPSTIERLDKLVDELYR